jgi:hypothetical protein
MDSIFKPVAPLNAGKKKARTNMAALKKPPWGEVEER